MLRINYILVFFHPIKQAFKIRNQIYAMFVICKQTSQFWWWLVVQQFFLNACCSSAISYLSIILPSINAVGNLRVVFSFPSIQFVFRRVPKIFCSSFVFAKVHVYLQVSLISFSVAFLLCYFIKLWNVISLFNFSNIYSKNFFKFRICILLLFPIFIGSHLIRVICQFLPLLYY